MATKPTVTIQFRQLATTLIERSQRGTAVLFLTDDSVTDGAKIFIYKNIAQVNTAYDDFFFNETEAGDDGKIDIDTKKKDAYQHIVNCFAAGPYEVVAIFAKDYNSLGTFTEALLSVRKQGWVVAPEDDDANDMQTQLASWIKSMEKEGLSFKGIGYEPGQDCKHYVYFNQTGTDRDGNPVKTGQLLAYLAGILASCNCTRSVTNYKIAALASCVEVKEDSKPLDEAISGAITKGQLVITNDDGGVKIVTGINSLTTLNGNTETEDMQYIETVEAMDLIRDDIRDVFINTYQGSFKNNYMNQMLFIGSVNEYFDRLAAEDILDSEFDNAAAIDIEAQRNAWLGVGKQEAAEWDEDTIKKMSFKRTVFVAADIKVLNCMENLHFVVTLE